ncbi:MAG: hypothetical protein ACM359_02640 [Bacillota bacterium]
MGKGYIDTPYSLALERQRYIDELAESGVAYHTADGRILFVHTGIGRDTWGTYWRKHNGAGALRRFTRLPVRGTKAEAQQDLAGYAALRRLKPVDVEAMRR